MISFMLVFVTGFIHIMGRPQDEINSNREVHIPFLPEDKNMFLLPRVLSVDEIINVTIITTKNNINLIDISLMAQQDTKNNSLSVICSFTVNITNNFVSVNYNDTNGDPRNEKMELEHFVPQYQENESHTSINVQFRRRKTARIGEGNRLLEVGSPTSSKVLKVRYLNKMRYLKFTGVDARVSNIGFEFN